MKYFIFILFVFISASTLMAQDTTSLVLKYDIDVTSLSDYHEAQLDAFIEARFDSLKKASLRIIGSADFLGSVEYNQKISDARVEGVVKYLNLKYEALLDSIYTQSEGELANNGYEDEEGGVQDHRSVTLSVVNRNISDAIEALGKAEAGERIVFNNLNFQPGRHYLLKRSIPELKRLLDLLTENPSVKIEIHGHICCVDFNNQKEGLDLDTNKYELSIMRAKNIYEYLVKKGIDPDRLSYKGFGSSRKLIYPEITEEDKTLNRRVEILLVEK
ncbi:MAG: OmpA family protein [Saprospiraceae bacterium]|nr:OmpA family protein [Saprospiraceae bacterium]